MKKLVCLIGCNAGTIQNYPDNVAEYLLKDGRAARPKKDEVKKEDKKKGK